MAWENALVLLQLGSGHELVSYYSKITQLLCSQSLGYCGFTEEVDPELGKNNRGKG